MVCRANNVSARSFRGMNMISHRLTKGVVCGLLLVIACPSGAANSTNPVLIEARGTWEAGKDNGQWTGQFAISLTTGAVSGNMRMGGFDEGMSVNVVGKAAGMSFSLEAAPQQPEAKQEVALLAGQTSGDTIEGTLSLPSGAVGRWAGRLSPMNTAPVPEHVRNEIISGTQQEAVERLSRMEEARVSEKVRAGLRAGTPQDVFIEFDRKVALRRVRAAQLARGVASTDRASMRELRAQHFTAVKDEVLSAVPAGDLTIKRTYRNLLTIFATLKDTDALERLIAHPEVVAVSANTRYELSSLTQSRQLIHATNTHSAGFRGAGTVIAIIDTGLDWEEDPVLFGTCPQGPGGPDCDIVVAMDTAPDDGFPDGNGAQLKHGTNVARNAGFTAAAADIIAYDAFDSLGIQKAYAWAALDNVIDQTASYNVVAVNMSFGGDADLIFDGYYDSQDDCNDDPDGLEYNSRFEELWDAGILAVTAAGNESRPAFRVPACAYRAISVGAVYDAAYGGAFYPDAGCTDDTTAADQVCCFSNATSFLSILAPGAFIAAVQGGNFSGTSSAAPFVTGAIAVLRGSNAFPDDHPECTRRRLVRTGAPIVDSRSGVPMTFPRLDVLAAVNSPLLVGDCNLNSQVNINELILGVNIALGFQSVQACEEFDTDESGTVSISELISGVNSALNMGGSCPMGIA